MAKRCILTDPHGSTQCILLTQHAQMNVFSVGRIMYMHSAPKSVNWNRFSVASHVNEIPACWSGLLVYMMRFYQFLSHALCGILS
jgi:hypothetical protein